MKKLSALLMAAAMALSLCACGGSEPAAGTPSTPAQTAPAEQEKVEASEIEVKGTFLLEPAEGLDLSGDGLAPVQRYVLVVYDVFNSSGANQELSPFNDSIRITFNNTNSYEQLYKSFVADCGYAVSTDYGTLWGGSEPVRMVASFAINGNDITDDCSAKIEFALSDDLEASADVAKADIQTINWFDDIFSVEANPDAYQIAHSVKNRAQICKTALENSSKANQLGQIDVRTTQLAICGVIFSEDATWGVACGSGAISEELPIFDIESVQTFYPEIATKITTIADSIKTMNSELEAANPNYDAINTAQRLAYNTLNEILEFFGD